jgi:hypothetical protein
VTVWPFRSLNAPVLTIVSGPIDVEAVLGVDPPVQEVVIRNEGGAELTWSASSDAAWMTFARGSGTLAAGTSETDSVVISVDGLALGSYEGTLTFTGNSANSPQTVSVSMEVVESPSIALEGTLEFEAWEGDSPENEPDLTVTNDGGGTLSWTASADQEWVTLSASEESLTPGSSATIRVTVDGSGLPAATHTALITVEGNADDSPQTAAVEFVATARPVMAPDDVADHLMGVRDALSQDEVDYLDEIGNGNGAFDVGAFRAWLQLTGMMGSARPGAEEEVAP